MFIIIISVLCNVLKYFLKISLAHKTESYVDIYIYIICMYVQLCKSNTIDLKRVIIESPKIVATYYTKYELLHSVLF